MGLRDHKEANEKKSFGACHPEGRSARRVWICDEKVMPILAPEADCYPADLFEAPDGSNDDESGQWWLIYTRSRRDKDLMRRLHAEHVPFYGPMISQRRRSPAGRVRETTAPLFPGYVFLRGNEEQRRVALQTNCISTISPIDDQERLVEELAGISRLIASRVAITPEQRLQKGQLVRVASGPLRGQEGVVIERRGKRRLLVAIDILQQGASVDLDECDLVLC